MPNDADWTDTAAGDSEPDGGGFGFKGKHRGGGRHGSSGTRIGNEKSSRGWAAGGGRSVPPLPPRSSSGGGSGKPNPGRRASDKNGGGFGISGPAVDE